MAAAALLAPQGAVAAITAYTSQSAFLAAISAPGIDRFDDLANVYLDAPLVRTAGPYRYTASAPDGFYPAGTAADIWLSPNRSFEAITLDIANPGVFALAGLFFTTDVLGVYQPGGITVEVTAGTATLSQTIVAAAPGSFLGFVADTPLSRATITSLQPGSAWPTVNDLTLGAPGLAAVPEPSVWALMIAGLGTIGAVLRRAARRLDRHTDPAG